MTLLCRCHMDWSDCQIHLQVGSTYCSLAADLLQKLLCLSTPVQACPHCLVGVLAPPDEALPCCRLDYFGVSAAAGNGATSSPFTCCPMCSSSLSAACCQCWLPKGCPTCMLCTLGNSAASLDRSCCLVCTAHDAAPASTAIAWQSEVCQYIQPLLSLPYTSWRPPRSLMHHPTHSHCCHPSPAVLPHLCR